jgi:hypothetical protein
LPTPLKINYTNKVPGRGTSMVWSRTMIERRIGPLRKASTGEGRMALPDPSM